MSDQLQPLDPEKDVVKSRKGLIFALLGILIVVAAIVGVAYATGIGPFGADEPEAASPKPTPAAQSDEATVTPVASPANVALPSADAQEAMYWEQVASATTIGDLVGDRFGSFDLSQIATTGDKADIRVKATYRDGSTMSGWLLLHQYEGAWYFAMITADGNPTTTPVSGTPDADVIKAIVEQQANNQGIYTAILDGGYKVIAVDRVTTGSGTATVDITLTGGSAGEAKGKITCISKDINGTIHWFITAFSKS